MVKTKSYVVSAKHIEPLNPEVVRKTNHEERDYVTGSAHSATLSIWATHYVLMESVSTTYNKMHPLHVVRETGSG